MAAVIRQNIGDTHSTSSSYRDGTVSVDRVPIVKIDAPAPDDLEVKWNGAECAKLSLDRTKLRDEFDQRNHSFRHKVEWEL